MYGRQSYYSFIIILYLYVFQFALMHISPVFNYWDELYAIFMIPLFIINLRTYRSGDSVYTRRLIILLILYISVGLLANVLFCYQVIGGVMTDVLLQLKFYFGIATTFYLFRYTNLHKYGIYIKRHVKLILVMLLFLVLLNKIMNCFPVADERYGINSEQLFFGHPTGLASVCYFLIILLVMFYDNTNDAFYLAIGVFSVLSTLRFKAIAASLLLCYMFFVIIVFGKKLDGWKLIPIIPFAVLVGWDEFYFYFFSSKSMETARGAMSSVGLRIARDYFPIGTGLGTFASDPSGKYYSPIYPMYGIEKVWGLGGDNPFLVSDTFWPMIIGQTGIIGLVLYLLIIVCLVKMIKPVYEIDRGCYLAGIGAIVYLLVSSIAESAFVNPLALPLSLIIGLVLCRIYQGGKDSL